MTDRPRQHNSTLRASAKRLARTKGLETRKRMNPYNRKRKAKRKAEGLVYGPYYIWAAAQPCEEAGSPLHRCGRSADRRPEAHHLKHVGSGGKDAGNLIFTCHALHDEFHSKTLGDMEHKYRKDYRARAVALFERSPFAGEGK